MKNKLINQAYQLVLLLREQLHENLAMSNKTAKILKVLEKANARYYRRYYS